MDSARFEASLKQKLKDTQIENPGEIGTAFNTGLTTMMLIAVTEFMKMSQENVHE